MKREIQTVKEEEKNEEEEESDILIIPSDEQNEVSSPYFMKKYIRKLPYLMEY
jgi:hypothetical protein